MDMEDIGQSRRIKPDGSWGTCRLMMCVKQSERHICFVQVMGGTWKENHWAGKMLKRKYKEISFVAFVQVGLYSQYVEYHF